MLAFDLNALQNPGNTWEFLLQNDNEGSTNGTRPSPRTNHTIISYNDQMYLFGGTNGTQWFNDVWTYDSKTNSWAELGCIGYIPAPREGHSAALVNDVMYIFGGRTEEGNDLGDLAAFRITSKRWYTFQNMGPSPSPRSGHSMTAHGKQIIVLAGEPSSAPRDSGELSMVYVLDTSKIRYPSDSAQPASAEKQRSGSPTRRPSSEARNQKRSVSRDGQIANDAFARSSPMGGPVQRPEGASNSAQGSRLPRASQAPAGPPPQVQPPNPRVNGTMSPPDGVRNRLPQDKSQQLESIQAPAVKAVQKDTTRGSRDNSPPSHGRRTPTQTSKARAMEAGEAAPMVGAAVARQRSLRSQRAQGSIDGTEEGALGRGGSNRHHSDTQSSVRSHYDEPRSPKLSVHQEALVKELEAAKRSNAWYASELSLARKAGYPSSGNSNSTLDDKSMSQFSDDDKPLIEAFMTMRAEMIKMHQAMEHQSTRTSEKIAEVEHQRDAAVTEAAYARAKLAAHGGSQRSTPQPDHSDEADRSTEISRRLALALAATNEHKSKLELIHNDLAAEKRARDAAEESSETAHRRLEELSKGRNPGELDGLRAELHEAQGNARSESSYRAEAEEQLRLLQAELESITEKHEHGSSRLKDSVTSIAALEAAVAASGSKATLYERQLDEERSARETAERKLLQLRSEHEERTNELESTSRRLRDVEELADTHAQEATTHRAALMAGLAKLSTSGRESTDRGPSEQRLAALQENAEKANALAKQHQASADAVADKLRAAEERIAGLEAYQEQSSRDGVQIRRQLQAALRDAQAYQAELRHTKASYESHQRDASALAVQHGALKDLLGERGMDMSTSRRSPAFGESPASRFGTPEQNRLKELETQLQSSMKSHDDTKSQFENRMQEADSTYREKLEQLENDYQSAVHYVKGTEKMLKKMKEELTKYKTANSQLQSDLDTARSASREDGVGGSRALTAEKDSLQREMEAIRTQLTGQISALEANLATVKQELASSRDTHDKHSTAHERLLKSTQQTEKDLEQLKQENNMLQTRAEEAEHRVTMLLDQVGTTVGNYRRQSQLPPAGLNGISHIRDPSDSTVTDTSSPDDTGKPDERGSIALDHLASELETLKTQWESTSRTNYRLSGLDFERTPTNEPASGEQRSDSLADWRRRLDLDEEERVSSSPIATKK